MNVSIKTRYGFALLISLLFLVIALINQSWQVLVSVSENIAISLPSRTQLAAVDGAGSGLVGWWKFDEAGGTTASDSSDNGNTGTLTGKNGPSVFKSSGCVVSGCLSLDGVDDYVSIHQGTGTNLNLSSFSGFTISGWLNSNAALGGFIGMGNPFNANGKGFNLMYGYPNTNQWAISLSGGGAGTMRGFGASSVMSTGTWTHITFVFTSTAVTLYKNGTLIGSVDISSQGISNLGNADIVLGNYSALSIPLNGALDDVRIYNRALSASEITDLYNQSSSGASSSASASSNASTQTTNTTQTTSNNGTTGTTNAGTSQTVTVSQPATNQAPVAVAVSSDDIALSKPYTMSPAPNYSYSTDSGDSTQLTDGQYGTKTPYLWVQQGAVGWQTKGVVTVTIDLGKTEPIGGLSFSTAAGAAGAVLPKNIFISTSDDGSTWYSTGDLVDMAIKNGTFPTLTSYTPYRFKATNLQTRGRYVKLVVVPSGNAAIVDEIEVLRGDNSLLSLPRQNEAANPTATDPNQMLVESRLARRLQIDTRSMLDMVAASSIPDSQKTTLNNELNAISNQIPSYNGPLPASFSTVFPINSLHSRIFAVQAALWRAKGLNTITVWPFFRWDMLTPTTAPQVGGVNLDMRMMSNEFRAQVFNVSNAGSSDADVKFSIEGLPGGSNPSYITVSEVPFTDTADNVPVAAALPILSAQSGKYSVHIASGLTKQIWLAFHPVNVSSGDYQGQIVFDGSVANIPPSSLYLKIYPLRFPDKPTLHLGGWDYLDGGSHYSVTPQNQMALLRILKEHFVDTPWAGSNNVMKIGTYDSNGHMIKAPDTGEFEAWVSLWPNASNYFVATAGWDYQKFAGKFDMGTPAFKQAVTEWINWWVAQYKSMNIQPSQIAIGLVDELQTSAQDNVNIQYARVIREAQPEVKIFTDMQWKDPRQGAPEMFDLSQILSPHLPQWLNSPKSFADFYVDQRNKGHELWFYSAVGPSHGLDPYTYYLSQAWFAWKYGAKGIEYWSFVDGGGTWGYNEYTANRIFTPMFISKTEVIGGKQIEAIREGVEDYEYLKMLNDRIVAAERLGINSSVINSAKSLLNGAADQVVSARTYTSTDPWSVSKDRTVSERVRLQILDVMSKIDSAFPNIPAEIPKNPVPVATMMPTPVAPPLDSPQVKPSVSPQVTPLIVKANTDPNKTDVTPKFIKLTYPDTTATRFTASKPAPFKAITNLDNSLLSIPTTTIDITVPKVPSWIEVLIAIFKEIVNRVKMGAGKTMIEIKGLF